MQTVVLHLDMNSYFASVEQQDFPELRGRPVGVCEHLGGIIIGASREAKRWGITTGTPVWEARKKYPKIHLAHTRPERYRFYTRRFLKVMGDYAADVDVYSIDEAFLDLTKACNIVAPRPAAGGGTALVKVDPFEEAARIAQEIKRRFPSEVGDFLTCSIGIGWNKTVAKIASDMQKPDGLTIVKSEKCKVKSGQGTDRSYLLLTKDDLYEKLELTDVPGIAGRMEFRLNQMGIRTLKDLRDYPQSRLVAAFGIMGEHLHHLGRLDGGDGPTVEKGDDIKSIGHMYTLPQEFRDKKYFAPVLYKLSEMVARRLRKQELMGNVLHFYAHGAGQAASAGKSRRLDCFLYDGREIFLECMALARELKIPDGRERLIGVSVAGLVPYRRQQSLFGDEERKARLAEALDRLNEKYGDFTVCRAPVREAAKVIRDSVGFGRVKEIKDKRRASRD